MTTITLNNDVRAFARSNPCSLLTLIGFYTTAGRVNNLDLDALREHVDAAHMAVARMSAPVREDFDSEEAYNDQANQLVIMKAFRLEMNYPFEAETVPEMITEMYARINGNADTRAAHRALSSNTQSLEKAFMQKAASELK